MNKIMVLVILLLASLCSFGVNADQYDADRHQMKLMLDDIREKLNHPDQLQAIVPYFDDNAIVTFYDARTVIGPDGLKNYIQKMVTGSNPVLKSYKVYGSEITPATVYSNNTATAYGWIKNNFEFVTGESIDVEGRWTATLIKESDHWKIVTLQFTANLFDNPLLNAIEHKLIYIAVITLVVGLLSGYFLTRLFFRRRMRSGV